MDEEGLRRMRGRMIRNKRTMGIALLAMSPAFYVFAPFGFVIAPALGALGILTIVVSLRQSAALARERP